MIRCSEHRTTSKHPLASHYFKSRDGWGAMTWWLIGVALAFLKSFFKYLAVIMLNLGLGCLLGGSCIKSSCTACVFDYTSYLILISGKSSLYSASIDEICFLTICLFSIAGLRQKLKKSFLFISSTLST